MPTPRRARLGVLALALGMLGCDAFSSPLKKHAEKKRPASESTPSSTSATTEAERTRRMDADARALNQRANEIRNMDGTEQEKEQAVNQALEQQQKLVEEGQAQPDTPPPP